MPCVACRVVAVRALYYGARDQRLPAVGLQPLCQDLRHRVGVTCPMHPGPARSQRAYRPAGIIGAVRHCHTWTSSLHPCSKPNNT